MFRTILIPTDFTPAAWKAMNLGLALGKEHNAQITLLHIYPISTKFSKENSTKDITDEVNRIRRKMGKMGNELSKEKGLEISIIVLSGNVENQLLAFVGKQQFDLVIMGVNSNGEDDNPGSHTLKIIEQSSTPLLIVPNSYTVDE